MLDEGELRREAAATGFRVESLERVAILLRLLEGLRSHPFLAGRLALKGGTALNLFVFDIPRLSVDVDVNYVGAVDRQTMLAERPRVEQAIEAVCSRQGMQVRRVPGGHAGGKWRLAATRADGRSIRLEIDVNFLLRAPIWPVVAADSRSIGTLRATAVPVLDIHELAAGKLAALFARSASRDVFDARELLRDPRLDQEKLRLGFVVYGGMSRRDWRDVSRDDVAIEAAEVDRQLVPLLRGRACPPRDRLEGWTQQLVSECRELLTTVLPLSPPELEFLRRLNELGQIAPDLLTPCSDQQRRIAAHPGLRWKAMNVREHRGLARDGPE